MNAREMIESWRNGNLSHVVEELREEQADKPGRAETNAMLVYDALSEYDRRVLFRMIFNAGGKR